MTSDLPIADASLSKATSSFSLPGKIKSIPQILHQEIIQTNSFTTSLATTMDFIHKKRKIKFNAESRLSLLVTVLLELLTFISIILYRWIHIHFFKKSDSYLLSLWIENFITFCFAKFLFKMFNLPRFTFIKNVSSLSPLLLLNGVIILIHGYDFVVFTRKSGGSEFFQFSIVLYLPLLLTVMRAICTFQIPPYFYNIITLFTILKITFLFQDPEFSLSFSLCLGSIIYATTYALYTVSLKADLQKFTALEIIYALSIASILILPIFIIHRQEMSSGITFKLIMASVLSSLFKLGSCYFTLVLLKQTDPIKTLVTINAAYIPDHFLQALIYKLDCNVSTCKVAFFIVLDFLVGHFRRQPKSEVTDETGLKYSLMK